MLLCWTTSLSGAIHEHLVDENINRTEIDENPLCEVHIRWLRLSELRDYSKFYPQFSTQDSCFNKFERVVLVEGTFAMALYTGVIMQMFHLVIC